MTTYTTWRRLAGRLGVAACAALALSAMAGCQREHGVPAAEAQRNIGQIPPGGPPGPPAQFAPRPVQVSKPQGK